MAPLKITLLMPCGQDKASTLTTLEHMNVLWNALVGDYRNRSVPLYVFAPNGWEDMLTAFDHPMRYYRAIMTPSRQHPANMHLMSGNLSACSSELPLAYALQVCLFMNDYCCAINAMPFWSRH